MSEFITHFGLDGKLFAAQAVNFFVLLIILKKFAYRPILDMLARRRREIEEGFRLKREAENALRHADQLREETLQRARVDALTIANDAEQAGRMRQEEIIAEAEEKNKMILHDARRVIMQERTVMEEEIERNMRDLVCLGIGRTIGKLPAEIRDRELIETALAELKTIRA